MQQALNNWDFLTVSKWEVSNLPVQVEFKQFRKLRYPLLPIVYLVKPDTIAKELVNTHWRIRTGIWRNVADLHLNLFCVPDNIHSHYPGAASRWKDQVHQYSYCSRFASPVWTYKAKDLSFVYPEIDIFNSPGFSIVFWKIRNIDNRWTHGVQVWFLARSKTISDCKITKNKKIML